MQRLIEAILVNKLLSKYEGRLMECQTRWDDDYQELKYEDIDPKRKSFLVDDVNILNAQIGAYECIVKDLKELIK